MTKNIFLICLLLTVGWANAQTSPGGVSPNLTLWLKANAGITSSGGTVSSWVDQSTNAFSFTQATTASQPLFTANSINYNPSLNFNGRSIAYAAGILGTATYTDINIFAVASIKSTSGGSNYLFTTATTGSELSTYVPYGPNSNVYWRPGRSSSDLVSGYGNFPNPIRPSVWSFTASTTAGQTIPSKTSGISYNGSLITSNSSMASFTGNNSATLIGSQLGNTDMAEMIVYTGAITAAQQNQIQSYLAIKYGITLNQTTPTNYINSLGGIVWNASNNGIYNKNVFGIGEETSEGLNQIQSKSNTSNRISIANPSAFNSGDYMILSDTGATSFTPIANSGLPNGLLYSSAVVWRVSKTGSVGTVDITINSTATNPKLMIDVDNDGVYDQSLNPTSVSGNVYTFAGVTLLDGNKFTLGYDAASVFPPFPGGVAANLKWWLKANVGTSTTTNAAATSTWADQSGNVNDATQATTAKQPLYANNAFNGNPALTFDQTDDGLGSALNISVTPYSVFTVYGDNFGSTAARRVVQGSNNWLIGPYAGKQSYYNGTWIDPQNLTVPNKQPFISLGTANPSTGYLNFFYVNGKNSSATTTGVAASGAPGLLGLGTSGSTNEAAGSNVAEVIAYDRVVTAAEKAQIESYLAIKYGITIDQTTATNYVNSVGAVVWNAATNTTYKNNIFGIGKDVLNNFSQSQSASANTSRISIGNPTPNLADGNYLFISDNNLATYPVATSNLPGGANYATPLMWNISNTNYSGTVDITLISNFSSPILLIDNDNDGTFELSATPASISGSNFSFTGITLNNLAKLAIGYAAAPPPAIGPGGVTTNLKLWFNANAGLIASGTNVTSWTDQSANSDNASTVVGTAPVITANAINGYPVVKFSGGGLVGSFASHLTSNRSTAFVVTKEGTNTYAGLFAVGNAASDASTNSSALLFYENSFAATDISTYRTSAVRGNYSAIPTYATPHMYSSIFNATQNLFFSDGNATNNAAFAQQNYDASKFSLGGYYSNGTLGSYSNSTIAEAILYDRDLTTTEQQHVRSYLAVKYGLSLPTDYVNFANTVIWDQSTNTGYNTDIIGIGIDNSIGLSQTSAISANNAFLKITTPSALVNGDFLMIGASNTSLVDKSTDVPSGVGQRTARVWKVQTTGAPGTVTLKFYVGAFPEVTSATLSQCGLLMSSTSSFAAGTPYTTGMTLSGVANDTLTFNGVSLANATYLALALPALAVVNTKWFAVPQWNSCSNLNQPQLLYLTAPLGAATAMIDQPGNTSFLPIRVNLASAATQSINLSTFMNNMVTTPANTVVNRGLRITVTGNKVVGYYQDASALNFGTLPLKSPYEIGLEFYVPGQNSFTNSTSNCGPANYCETIIISTVDNNTVTITPTENLVGHALTAGAFNITLNKGQSYQAQSISPSSIHQAGEHITSTGNIAVTYIDDYLNSTNNAGQDNAGDQLVPVTKVGTTYVGLRTNLNSSPERINLTGIFDNTVVTINDGVKISTLNVNKGQLVAYTFPSDTTKNAAYLTANNPVSAYQIGGVNDELGGGILPPVFTCSGSSSVAYFRNSTISIINADVIVPTGAQGGFIVNGSNTILAASDFTVVPGLPNWMYARKNITSATTAGTLLNISNNIASFHMGFTELSGGGGDYCYFSEFVTVPVDYGELPVKWPAASANTAGCASIGGTTLSNTNATNTTSVWAGNAVDFEEVAKINATATGDLHDDGLTAPSSLTVGVPANFSVILNNNAAGKTIYYRLWFDWNNDGNFANDNDYNGSPATYAGSGVSQSGPVTVTVPVNAPSLAADNSYAVRLIVSDASIADAYRSLSPTTVINVANGEVEDYILPVSVVLPVTLVRFTVTANGCSALVNWQTATELNNSHYDLELSTDGKTFTKVAEVKSQNSANGASYSYIQKDLNNAITYFRLKAVDNDAKYTYGPTVPVATNCNGAVNAVIAYPNPFNRNVSVAGAAPGSNIQLLDAAGKVLVQQKSNGSGTDQLFTSMLAQGIYLIKVQDGKGTITTLKLKKD